MGFSVVKKAQIEAGDGLRTVMDARWWLNQMAGICRVIICLLQFICQLSSACQPCTQKWQEKKWPVEVSEFKEEWVSFLVTCSTLSFQIPKYSHSKASVELLL
jgi:hypothetical protein